MAEITVPQVDFSILGNLGNTFQEGQAQSLATLGRRKAAEALGRGDTQGALSALVGSGDARTLAALGQYQTGANSVYGTPIYGTNDKGETAIGTFDKSGRFRPIDTPGFRPTPGIKTVDTGTGTMVIDTRTGQPIQGRPQAGQPMQQGPQPMQGAPQAPPMSGGYIPKDVAGEARGKKVGAEQAELMANKGKNEQALTQLESQWRLVDDTITDALKRVDWTNAGFIGGKVSKIEGTPAFDLAKVLETIKGNIGFDKLQSMRENSPTGGALGQVSDFENRLLQSVRGAIEQGQSPGQLRANLARVQRDLRGLQQEKRKAFERTYSGVQPIASGATGFTGQPAASQPVTKTIGGKNYIKMGNDWFEQ